MVSVGRRTKAQLLGAVVFTAALTAAVALPAEDPTARAAADPVIATAGDPVIAAAGDISCDPTNSGYNGGAGTATDCRQRYTANLLTGTDAVLPLGDLQYACGGLTAFQQAYDPSWGAYKAITKPVPGNHEYQTSGGTGCSTNAAGYYTYFGSTAGDPTKGYYSYDLGSWHLIALNSECAQIGGCGLGSPQESWLRSDLAAHASAPCTLAYWHRPRFGSTSGGGDTTFQQFWQDLYVAHADVVLGGHQHWYERFALQNPSGQPDANGLRQFIVGTGGESYVAPASTRAANSEVLFWGQSAFGVLKMTLHQGSYDWTFVPESGSLSDTGTQTCHNAPVGPPPPDTTPPTTSAICNGSPCTTGWYRSAPVTVQLSATDGGTGVAATYYTTDGSTPTQDSPRYVSPVAVSETTMLRYYSVDVAGNAEAVRSTPVSVDAAAPTVTLTSPVNGATVPRRSTVTLTATAGDLGTGAGSASGVATVGFYLDGNLITLDGEPPYTYAWSPKKNLRGNHTLTAVATDRAGNATTSGPVRITFG